MRISRRTLLRGAGVSLGFPWLEAMMPAARAAQAPKNPVRMAMLYMPNGVNVAHWYPKGAGREFELSPTLEPLADLKDQILVLSNLWNADSKGGDGHYVKEAAILTCTTIKKTPGADIAQRRLDGPGGRSESRRSDSAALARARHYPGGRRRRSRRRVHAHLRLAHLLERPRHSARARAQSAVGI